MKKMGVFVCLFLGLSAAWLSAPAGARAQGQVNLSLDWVVGGRHSPYFLALEKGYYRQEGLDVKIHRGFGSSDSIKRLVGGGTQYAFADIGSLVLAHAKEKVGAKSVAVVYSDPPHGLTYIAGRGISSPKDLEGKKVAGPAGSSVTVLFPAFAEANGVDVKKVEWVIAEPATLTSLLGAGNVHAIVAYTMDTAIAARRFAPMGYQAKGLFYKDYGLSFYSNGVITSSERIRSRPEEVRKFVRATLRGLVDSFRNPEEAVDLMRKTHPAVGREMAIPEVGLVRDLALSEEALLYGLGYHDRKKMDATRTLVLKGFKVTADLPVENLYTNEFLPQR